MLELMPFQRDGVAATVQWNGRILIADEMGLGKTIQALGYMCADHATVPAVAVVPAHVKWNWRREAERMGIVAEVLEGREPKRRAPDTPPHLYIINYQILKGWVPWLRRQDVRLIILDECQAIQDQTTQQSKAVKALAAGVPKVVALSGTPLTNRPKNLYPVLHLLRPDLFPAWRTYAFRYCDPKRLPWGWTYDGATRLDELHKILTKNLMIRRLKSDVIKELPLQSRHVNLIPLTDRREYDAAEQDFLGWLAGVDVSKAAKAERAKAITKVSYLRALAGKWKLRAAADWVANFLEEKNEKIVVFAWHTKAIEAMARRFGHKSVTLTGGMNATDKQAAVDAFQHDDKVRVFIGNLAAASTGITLTAASTVAFTELGWIPAQHIQAESRVHRIGQTVPCFSYYLLAANTIEEKVFGLIAKKQQLIDQVLDGKVVQEFDLLEQLLVGMKENGKA